MTNATIINLGNMTGIWQDSKEAHIVAQCNLANHTIRQRLNRTDHGVHVLNQ